MKNIAPSRMFFWCVLAGACFLYFWHLSRPDIITDESSYAVRAIKMVDFDFGIEQPTPWQWTDRLPPGTRTDRLGVPWWMRLSFHDHPPLVFLLQHYSIALFGENPFAIRLPSVLAGLAAVWFVFLIASELYSPFIALASAGLFAFTVNHVWIARIGLQESVVIALMLASFWAFLKAFKNPRWFSLSGLLLGLAFLSKYLALILVPIFATILVWRRMKKALPPNSGFHIVLAVLVALAVTSPIIAYNFFLYRYFGHFDFQFSLLLHQNVPDWQSRPGQETLGSFSNRIVNYIPWLIQANSPYLLALALLGLVFAATDVRDRRRAYPHWPLLIALFWTAPFLVFIGPAHRFLAILTPFLAVAAAYGLTGLIEHIRLPSKHAHAILAGVLAIELLYSFSSVIATKRIGAAPWTYAYIGRQTRSYGFNELEKYLASETARKRPETPITFQFPFAKALIAESNAKKAEQGFSAVPLAIVYNDNINLSEQLWIFLRRIVYDGWPMMSAENFRRQGGQAFLKEIGATEVIFINPTERALQDRSIPPTPDGDVIEIELKRHSAVPVEIKNPDGETTFHVYRFGL